MTDDAEPVLRIEPRWQRWRYLLDDGHVLDVDSPYRADSTDRDAVLDEAARRWGTRAERKIVGVAAVPAVELPTRRGKATGAKRPG